MENTDLMFPVIFKKMLNGWKKSLLIFTSSILFMSLLYYVFPRYDAQSTFFIGNVSINEEPVLIESTSKLIDFLTTPSQLVELEKVSGISGLANELISKDYGGHGKLIFLDGKAPGSLVIKISASSKVLAQKEMDAIISTAVSRHKELTSSYLVAKNKEIETLFLRYEQLNSDFIHLPFVSGGLSKILIEDSLLKYGETLHLRKQKLTYPYTYPSQILGGEVFINRNSFPRLLRFLFFGFILGLVIALLLFRNDVQKSHEN